MSMNRIFLKVNGEMTGTFLLELKRALLMQEIGPI